LWSIWAAPGPHPGCRHLHDYFERPGIPYAGNREAAASAVATACGL
jgi:hypothetical protein